MSLKSRIREIELIRQPKRQPIVVLVREDETNDEALSRVTNGEGAKGANVIYIHGGLSDVECLT